LLSQLPERTPENAKPNSAQGLLRAEAKQYQQAFGV
jgi:hypothetical protein